MEDTLLNLKNRLITIQQQEIAALKRDNRKLQQDNNELIKILEIALQDKYGSSYVVIDRKRFDETHGEFELGENINGDLLIRVRRKS